MLTHRPRGSSGTLLDHRRRYQVEMVSDPAVFTPLLDAAAQWRRWCRYYRLRKGVKCVVAVTQTGYDGVAVPTGGARTQGLRVAGRAALKAVAVPVMGAASGRV